MIKIVCVEPLGIEEKKFEELKNEFSQKGCLFNYYLDRNEEQSVLIERMKDADMVIVSNIPLSREVLQECSKLKFLSVAFTGLDHIDLEYCKTHGIDVKNAAGYSTTAVSELSVALMLDVLRKITSLDGALHQGGSRGAFLGRELKGKTIGIVGTGAIGIATIRLLQAFGCHVIAYSRSQRDEVKQMGVNYLSLNDLLSCSDIVSLHVPLTNETHHLIGRDQLSLMKPSAILINTARGNVMDIDAVAEVLCSGHLAGLGIDVYEKEPPLDTNHPILRSPNCVAVPHIGYATRESFAIRADIVMDNIRQKIDKYA